MAVTIAPKWDNISTSESLLDRNSSARLRYIAYGDSNDTEEDVRNALKLYAPDLFGTLIKSHVAVLSFIGETPEGMQWDTEVTYSHADEKDREKPSDESTVILEIRSGGGSTANRTYSEALVEEVFNDDVFEFEGTNVERVLGLKAADADSGSMLNAQGVPVKTGGIQIIVHFWKSNAKVSNGFLLGLSEACDEQCVNAGTFKGFPGGSLQFSDFSATQKASTNIYQSGWEFSATLDFAREITPSVPGLPAFTKKKKGHEYLDVLWMPELIPVKNVVVSKAVRAAIHQLYPSRSFQTVFDMP